ncbi:methyltransferase domain-containing protein [Methylobacterium nodulans]|nr:methyltransferase domain-containing protein [Methylobacterium nodulans]
MHIPDNWTFQRPEIAAAFDAHVREQLPWYELATGIVVHFARHFIADGSVVIDLGASTGNIGRALAPTLRARRANLIAVDNSPAMLEAYAAPGVVEIGEAESYDFAARRPDLIICFLSLMFVRPAERLGVINRMKAALRPAGALIVFDKREPIGGEVGQIMYRLTLAAKYEAGAKPDEVIAKELSLAGVQRPMHAQEMAGFTEIFRFGDFSGWIFAAAKVWE